jgi:hypothetical protein
MDCHEPNTRRIAGMLSNPERQEIDGHTGKLIVGIIAILLASVTNFLAGGDLDSISESYHRGGLARDVFVGALLAISAFLASYNGYTSKEMKLAKIAAVAAIGIALFPCLCPGYFDPRSSWIHGFSAAAMFLILAFFCRTFYLRAKDKGHTEAMRRCYIYAVCGFAIVGSILVLVIDWLLDGAIVGVVTNLLFIGETVGLVAFGVAWLTASRALPFITNADERILPLR